MSAESANLQATDARGAGQKARTKRPLTALLTIFLGAPKVATIFGIQVRVHGLFVLLFVALAIVTWREDGGSAALHTVLQFVALFACVLLHELGHSLMAKRHGVRVFDILLWPLGGVARIERIPDSTRAELQIALAGPAVNLVILLLVFGVAAILGEDLLALEANLERVTFLQWLMLVNFAMGTFNLLPAFPMDGGRVLRALLARKMEPLRATCIAIGIGRSIALAAIIAGLSDPSLASLAILGVFVWIAGGIELGNSLRHAAALTRQGKLA